MTSFLSRYTMPYRSKMIIDSFKRQIKKNFTMLDIGCGNGITTQIISDSLKIKATGCDIENYLDVSLPFYPIPKNGKLPFKDRSFDVAMLNDVLHHIEKEDQLKVLKEALRVARKVLIFEAKPTLSGKIFDIMLNRLHYHSLKTPLTFRTGEDWSNVFKKMDLTYDLKNIKKPIWYPFSHIAMVITKKKKTK